MVKPIYTDDQQKATISAWYEAKANNVSMDKFLRAQEDAGLPSPSVGTLRNWLGLNPKRSSGIGANPSVHSTPSKTLLRHHNTFSVEIDLEAKFNEMYEAARPAAYLRFLQEQTEAIRAKVLADTDARIQQEIEKLQGKTHVEGDWNGIVDKVFESFPDSKDASKPSK